MSKLRVALLVFFTVFTPIGVGILIAVQSLASLMIHKDPAPYPEIEKDIAAVVKPWLPRTKTRVLVLLSNRGNELTDIASVYDTFGRLPDTEVKSVALERKLIPSSAQLAMLPDYLTTDPEAQSTDVLVVPGMMDSNSPHLAEYFKARAAKAKFILCLGEGARICAATGLLDDQKATSHFIAMDELKSAYPRVQWRNGPAALLTGRIITSAGIVASIDANLLAIEQAFSKPMAMKVANEIGYNPQEFEIQRKILWGDALRIFTQSAYHWGKWHLLAWIAPGTSELAIAGVIDVLPRTFSFSLSTVSEKRSIVTLAHGLKVVTTDEIATVLPPDALLLPAQIPSGPSLAAAKSWASSLKVREVNFSAPVGQSFEESLRWPASEEKLSAVVPMTPLAAKMVSWPWLNAASMPIPFWFIVRPLLLALLGFMIANILTRGLKGRG